MLLTQSGEREPNLIHTSDDTIHAYTLFHSLLHSFQWVLTDANGTLSDQPLTIPVTVFPGIWKLKALDEVILIPKMFNSTILCWYSSVHNVRETFWKYSSQK